MIKKPILFAFIFVLFSIFTNFAQSSQWKEINENQILIKEKMNRGNVPHTYQLFDVNLTELTSKLIIAPDDTTTDSSTTYVNFPDGNGNISSFEIFKSQMLEPELAAQNPNIHNFTGINRKDPSNVIKISITPAFGMHIMGYNGEGTTYYVDTYTTDFNTYIFYKRSNIENSNKSFKCLVEDTEDHLTSDNQINSENQILSTDSKFRRYRFAMACTTEYAAFHVNAAPNNVPQTTEAQKKQIVLAAMNVTINRLNSIYERDLSIRFVLVANNTNIIFINSDNFANDDPEILIDQSQAVITNIIGTPNFDIGHTVSTEGGGLASPSPCDASSKASGITGVFFPVGDPFDIDYVAHEVGHQFWASHTYNNLCFGNRNNATAVEPGSGTTIMAYAGICAPNIQDNSDAYFHQISIQEISEFLQSNWNNCPTIISTANPSPTITSTSGNKTIPNGTPFILTTNATDTNNPNSLTYTWEQMNNNISEQPPLANATTGPNFRSVIPTSNPSRSFPSTATVLAGTTNANGIVSSTWERLPTVARTMKFATTVRDNNGINGGQTKSAEVNITFANVGPFVITYPNNITTTTEPNWSVGQQKTITWNVAGTTANGINTSQVNILMSQDNGQTYPFVLAANTPNDGSQSITVPALTDATLPARIKIEAVGNIFYTVSKPIGISVTATNDNFEFDNFSLYPNPTSDIVTISFTSTSGNEINMEVFDIRGRKLKSVNIENIGTISSEIDLSHYDSGIYLVKIKDGSNQSTKKIIKK
ncbi:T9SS C-terminal target domain-containing protein [Paenimyroides tangerinum]|uniref:T9SS C-terminal target domain-containing protein n=2 Tax=Paenimyroides tangerinum TaxID=2488728 RepID=A0A3P3WB60_9FLAO|nr:T9SS C-terminal target domain-containing protein [Paenimyroides tangerinum]